MHFSHPARLWAVRAPRTVCLLRNGQVELVWDRVVVGLRRADLIVLHRTLRHWLHEAQPDAAEAYLVMLDDTRLGVRAEDMAEFCALVADAVAQIPRAFVRWADLRVRIVPFPTASDDDSGLYGLN
jgi:hypothetical protein